MCSVGPLNPEGAAEGSVGSGLVAAVKAAVARAAEAMEEAVTAAVAREEAARAAVGSVAAVRCGGGDESGGLAWSGAERPWCA